MVIFHGYVKLPEKDSFWVPAWSASCSEWIITHGYPQKKIAMENEPFIDDFRIKKLWFSSSQTVSLPEGSRVSLATQW